MGRAGLVSFLFHVAIALALVIGLPQFGELQPSAEPSVTVELVDTAPSAPKPPAAAKAATAKRAQVATAKPKPPPPPQSPPEPEPQPVPQVPPPPAPEPTPPPKPEPAPPPPPEPTPPPKPAPAPAPQPEPAPAPKPEPAPKAEPAPKPAAKQAPAPKPTPPPKPKETAKAEPPQPKPPAKPKPAAAKPAPKAEPPKPKEDEFAALLQSVEQLDRKVQSDQEQTGKGRAIQGKGDAKSRSESTQPAPITSSELASLQRQIGGCWTLPAGIDGIDTMVVKLRIQVRPDRTVQRVTVVDSGSESDPRYEVVADSARRAVERCSPLNLPSGKEALWSDMILNFRPADAING